MFPFNPAGASLMPNTQTLADGDEQPAHEGAQSANVIVNAARQGRMGIESLTSRIVMNTTAVALMCGGACWLVFEMNQSAKEDRSMFREELKALRVDAQERFVRTEAAHTKSMEKMGNTVERAVTSMEKATRVLEKTVDKQDNP